MKKLFESFNIILKFTASRPARVFANFFFLNKERINHSTAINTVFNKIITHYNQNSLKKKIVAEECKLMQKFYLQKQIKIFSAPKYKKIADSYKKNLEELSQLNDSEQIIEYLAKYYTEDMAADFDPFFTVIFKELAKFLFSDTFKYIKITENSHESIKKIIKLQGKYPIFLLPNHISNSDHLPLCIALNKANIFQPVIVAGANLYRGVSKNILPKFNCYKLQRDYIHGDVKWLSNPIYSLVFKYYNYFLWEKNEPFLFYMEGTRSRDGKILPPKYGFLKESISFSKDSNQTIFFIPISISYTVVPEDRELVESLKGKNISEKDIITQNLELNRIYKNVKDATIFINISNPIPFTPDNNDAIPSIAKNLMKTISNKIVITPTYRLAYILTSIAKDTFNISEVREYILNRFFPVTKGDYRFLKIIEREIKIGIDIFIKKGIIAEVGFEEYDIIEPMLLEQYANRVAHFRR